MIESLVVLRAEKVTELKDALDRAADRITGYRARDPRVSIVDWGYIDDSCRSRLTKNRAYDHPSTRTWYVGCVDNCSICICEGVVPHDRRLCGVGSAKGCGGWDTGLFQLAVITRDCPDLDIRWRDRFELVNLDELVQDTSWSVDDLMEATFLLDQFYTLEDIRRRISEVRKSFTHKAFAGVP